MSAERQPLLGVMLQPPSTQTHAGTADVPRLVNVHIPKNAGSSIGQWSYFRRITFNPVPTARCNSTYGRGGHQVFGAPTWEHCVNSYTTNENQSGFCILRDPLDHLISEFNHASGRGCSPSGLNRALRSMIAHGSADNHDAMQIEYAAFSDFFLCFNTLQADWEQLISRAHVLRQPAKNRLGVSRAVIERLDARDNPAFLPRSSPACFGHSPVNLRDTDAIANLQYSRLPVVRRGSKGSCQRSDVNEATMQHVADQYAADYALYRRACVEANVSNLPFWSRPTAVGAPTRDYARQLLSSSVKRISFGETNRWPAYDAMLSPTAARMPLRQFT